MQPNKNHQSSLTVGGVMAAFDSLSFSLSLHDIKAIIGFELNGCH